MEDRNLMDYAPYLCPWYLRKNQPELYRNQNILEWRPFGNEGLIALSDNNSNYYGIFTMGSYILISSDKNSFLVWHRDLEESIGLQSIEIFYYETDCLQAIVNKEQAASKMKQSKRKFLFAVAPKAKVQFQINPSLEAMKTEFPNDFKKFGEFIFITELQNLYNNQNPKSYWHNTTMLCINANTNWIFNYPQDWFNKSNADFMYEWITRAIRNPETGLIYGQGIRLPDFVLDKTNRQLASKK